MLLEQKSAVIYGAGGAVGGAVARAFAQEGARVCLPGRTLANVVAVAPDIRAAGGNAEAARVDALDERAVEEHLAAVVKSVESMTHRKRSSTLAEVANMAVVLASDQASGMTGTVANLTGGLIVD